MANAKARKLRSNMTEAEKCLWRKLRELNQQGRHFRRQAPLGEFIVDFCEHAARLVIEVDGWQHNSEEGIANDRQRTSALERAGYRVVRFWNNEVLENTEGVLQQILRVLNDLHPFPSPPEKAGL